MTQEMKTRMASSQGSVFANAVSAFISRFPQFNSPAFVVFPGFCDVHVHFREPGFSYKETIFSGSRAAARGGYTAVCTMPNLNPVPDSIESLNAQLNLIEKDACIHVYPYGAGLESLLLPTAKTIPCSTAATSTRAAMPKPTVIGASAPKVSGGRLPGTWIWFGRQAAATMCATSQPKRAWTSSERPRRKAWM